MATQVTARHVDDGPYPGAHVGEIVEADIDTDGSGDGSLSVSFEVDFAAAPAVTLADTAAPAADVANATNDGFDIDVSGSSTTSGTVSATAIVRGPRA